MTDRIFVIGRRFICLSVLLCLPAALQAESRLIFPRIVLQQGRFTGVAIANPTGSSATLTLRAYRDDGTLFSGSGVVNPRTETIAPGEQYSRLAAEIFSIPASVAEAGLPTYLWMEVSSPTDGLTGFFLDVKAAGDNVDFMDGADLAGTGTDLVLPFIENNATSTTEISLVNPDDSAAKVVLDFIRADGSTVATQTVDLSGRGALHAPLSTAFAISYAEVAAMRLRSDRAVICYGHIHRQTDDSTVTLAAQSHGLPAKTLYFPQLAEGEQDSYDWSTWLGLLNFGRLQVLAKITAYKPDGTLFSAPAVKANPVSRTIAPDGVLRVDLRSLFGFVAGAPVEVGWIKVETNREALHGYVEYSAGSNRALVMAQVESYGRSIFSHQAMVPPFYTGLSVLNPANVAANIEVVSLDKGGYLLGRTQQVLRGRQSKVSLVDQWILFDPRAPGIEGGSVFVKSDQPVVATQVFGTRSNSALANVPPQKVTTNFDPTTHWPHLRVSPPLWVLETGKTKQFNSEGVSGARWQVNGVAGGNSSIGTISDTGVYRAPALAPAQRIVTILAADTAGQSAGASVEIVQRETLVAGLTQLTAIAYLENLHRFFIAEQQILTSIVVDEGSPRATTANAKISEQSSSGTKTAFAQIENETIGEMLPFVDAGGTSYILIAGTGLGKIYRLNVLNKKLDTVVSGLNKPNSLALDPISRNLLVSEEGANQITVVERSKFDPLAAVVTDPEWRKRPKAVAVAAPRGVAVDGCSGAVYVTSADGQLREYRGDRIRTVISGLNDPSEILVLYREGFSSCQEALSLLVAVNNEVLQIFPQTSEKLTFLSGIANVVDLIFFPKDSPFIPQGEQAVGLAEAPPGDGTSRISNVRVGGLYENVGPQATPPAEPSLSKLPFQDPRGDTFASDLSSSNNLQAPDLLSIGAQQLSGATVITLTFARPVAPLSAAAPNSVRGFVDFDLRPTSGVASQADSYNKFAPTGMGVDYYVDLSSGVLRDVAASRDTTITVQFSGENLTLQIPLSVVDLSGARMTLVVGNRLEITDLAPNAGVIEFIAPNAAACLEGIKIIDANLDTAVRSALKINSTAIITCAMAQTLTSLDASFKGIKSLAGLEYFTNLEVLDVQYNAISDVTSLSGLTKLNTLYLNSNRAAPNLLRIAPLSGLTALTFLDLRQTAIADIAPLSRLTNLQYLYLDGNAITDVTPLAGLVRLTDLSLSANNIASITPLSSLTSLQILDLGGNSVSDIGPVSGMTRMKVLDLDFNKITDLSPLAPLTALERLNLGKGDVGGNTFSNLSPLAGMKALQYLNLTGNQVNNISPLSGLTNLNVLDLDNCSISDITPLLSNSGLGTGDRIDLFYNNLTTTHCLDLKTLVSRGAVVYYSIQNSGNLTCP